MVSFLLPNQTRDTLSTWIELITLVETALDPFISYELSAFSRDRIIRYYAKKLGTYPQRTSRINVEIVVIIWCTDCRIKGGCLGFSSCKVLGLKRRIYLLVSTQIPPSLSCFYSVYKTLFFCGWMSVHIQNPMFPVFIHQYQAVGIMGANKQISAFPVFQEAGNDKCSGIIRRATWSLLTWKDLASAESALYLNLPDPDIVLCIFNKMMVGAKRNFWGICQDARVKKNFRFSCWIYRVLLPG